MPWRMSYPKLSSLLLRTQPTSDRPATSTMRAMQYLKIPFACDSRLSYSVFCGSDNKPFNERLTIVTLESAVTNEATGESKKKKPQPKREPILLKNLFSLSQRRRWGFPRDEPPLIRDQPSLRCRQPQDAFAQPVMPAGRALH